jgi:mRNA-degrading endonuclease toxin of MazEF toxin-antitoxin module
VLVIRPFNAETFFGIALIGHPRSGRFYFPLGKVEDREAVANLSQVRLFDTKRLIRKIGMLEERTFRELGKALALTLFPFLPLK